MKNLFVGNLPFNSTEDALRAHFAQFGEVQQVRIMTDRDTGKPRGFAFVQMSNDEEALKAIGALNGGFGSGGGRSHAGGRRRESRDDYRGAVRQPKEPRW